MAKKLEPVRVVKPFEALELDGEPATAEFKPEEVLYVEERSGEHALVARKPEVDEACRAAVAGEVENPEPVEFLVRKDVLEGATDPLPAPDSADPED